FAAPNPDDPGRTVLVVAGAGPLGTWRSRFLPDLVPDYVVYDEHVAHARGRVLLGPGAGVLAAGFWSADGTHPADGIDDHDPVTPTASGAGVPEATPDAEE